MYTGARPGRSDPYLYERVKRDNACVTAAARSCLLRLCITLAIMHFDTLTAPEQRVLGCLIEKRFTTPEQYPLTLNALRLACNQSTNRDPVVEYDEETVRDAAQRLSKYGLTRLASGHTSRATKYRHLAEEALGLGREQLAVLAVLLLRGAQTPGELKVRTERVVDWDSLAAVELVLSELIERDYAQRLERRPGQKEERFTHLFGGPSAEAAAPVAPPTAAPMPGAARAESVSSTPGDAPGGGRDLLTRLNAIEKRVEQLTELVDELLSRQGETDQVGDAADEEAREGHLEAGRPPGP
jgi:uncharacterized protein YceH (UPF0502 family)